MALRLAVEITGDAAGLREGIDAAGRQMNQLAARGERMARRIADGLDRAGRRMRAIGQRLSLAVTAPLVALGTVAVRAFDVQIQAERRLAAAIRATGAEASAQLQVYQEIAKTLQSVTTIGDEATLANMQVARSMGLSARQSARAARNAIALSDAFGINAQSAIRYTAALEQGDTTMLNRYIPTLRNIEDETERVAEAQRILSEAFELSIESARTGLGPFRQLANSVGDLAEQFGQNLLEGINPVINRARALVAWLQELDESTRLWALNIAAVVAGIGPFLVALGLLTQALAFVARGLAVALAAFMAFGRGVRLVARAVIVEMGLLAAAFSGPVGAAVAATTAIVVAFVGFRDTIVAIAKAIYDGVRKWLVVEFNRGIADPFNRMLNRLITSIPQKLREAMGIGPVDISFDPVLSDAEATRKVAALRERLAGIQERLRDDPPEPVRLQLVRVGEGLADEIAALERGLASGGTGSMSKVADAFRGDMARIRGEFEGILEGIRAQLPEGLFNAFFGDLETVTPDIDEAQRRLAELMAQLPDGGLPAALAGEGGAGGAGGGAASLEDLSEQLRRLSEGVGALPAQIEGVRSEIGRLGQEIARDMTQPLFNALRGGIGRFQSFSDAMVSIGNDMADRLMQSAFSRIEEALNDLFDRMSGGGSGGGFLASLLGLGASAAFPTSVHGANLAGLTFAHGGVLSGGRVTAFADGGVVTRPTLFPMARGAGLMAEEEPEAIMPLVRLPSGRLGVESAGGGGRGGGGGGGRQAADVNVTQNFYGYDRTQVRQSGVSAGRETGRAVRRAQRYG